MNENWPKGVAFSMAPWGYVVQVDQIENTETGVLYECKECGFQSGFDPRDMSPEAMKQLFRWHVDQSH
jgi:hypothetical protein